MTKLSLIAGMNLLARGYASTKRVTDAKASHHIIADVKQGSSSTAFVSNSSSNFLPRNMRSSQSCLSLRVESLLAKRNRISISTQPSNISKTMFNALKNIRIYFAAFALAAMVSACSDNTLNTPEQLGETSSKLEGDNLAQSLATTTEGFEVGSKTSYATGSVTLGTGSWTLSDALIGTSTSDRKSGLKSARIINAGKITMNFNRTTGAGVVSIKHAKYGSDANSSWELWRSTNNGSSWVKVGSTVTSSSATLATVTFSANIAGTVRLEIRKVSGGSARINIDHITITDYSAPPSTPVNLHLTMGNPSNAVTSVSATTNYLHIKPQWAMSFNSSRVLANWVAWHLDKSWISGNAIDNDPFRTDRTLPSTFYTPKHSDYDGTGFSRGHLCPSADRKKSQADMDSTYLMTNMIPQTQAQNGGAWKNLEDYCRKLADAGNELYIYAGPSLNNGGSGLNGGVTSSIKNGINVPASVWKVIIVLPQGEHDITRVTTSTRVIAVNMPNNTSLSTDWGSFRVKVDDIESMTNLDFFKDLPDNIENAIESVKDNGATK